MSRGCGFERILELLADEIVLEFIDRKIICVTGYFRFRDNNLGTKILFQRKLPILVTGVDIMPFIIL